MKNKKIISNIFSIIKYELTPLTGDVTCSKL